MKNYRVSIIMPVYNSGKYVGEAIQSILDQSFADFELIIINDASSDNSFATVAKFAATDPRIRVVNHSENQGQTISRIDGMRVASGKYIAFLDSDDIAERDRLETQVYFLDNHLEIDLVGSAATIINAEGQKVACITPPLRSEQIKKTLTKRNCFFLSSIMLRNTSQARYRSKMRYGEDYDFLLCLLASGHKFSNIKKPLVRYRILSSSVTRTQNLALNLFAEQARIFFYSEVRGGLDLYSQFDPELLIKNNSNYILNNPGLAKTLFAYEFKNGMYKKMIGLAKQTPLRSLVRSPKILAYLGFAYILRAFSR